MADEEQDEFERTLAAEVEAVRQAHPGRQVDWVMFNGEPMIVFRPTEGQVAALARLSVSVHMDDIQRVANFLDTLEQLIADEHDRRRFAGQMLTGEIDFGRDEDVGKADAPVSALQLLELIAAKFGVDENRADRRARARRVR